MAEITAQLEDLDSHPLLLYQFVLDDGFLRWSGAVAAEPR